MLVTMKEILDHAKKGGYGVTAPNVQSEDTVRAVLEVAEEYHAPMIVDVNAFIHTDLPWFIHMIRDLAEKVSVLVAINLDHGNPMRISCSVSIPGLHLSWLIVPAYPMKKMWNRRRKS